jgi:hypothetical protein
VVFGTMEWVKQGLSACGWQINRAFVARLHLALRQRGAAVGRRVNTLGKGEAGMRQQLALLQSYHHFCLPHASLRVPLAEPEPPNGTGSAQQWRPCTLAMAAGVRDHVGRYARCCSCGCRRGTSRRRSETWCGVMSGVLSG